MLKLEMKIDEPNNLCHVFIFFLWLPFQTGTGVEKQFIAALWIRTTICNKVQKRPISWSVFHCDISQKKSVNIYATASIISFPSTSMLEIILKRTEDKVGG